MKETKPLVRASAPAHARDLIEQLVVNAINELHGEIIDVHGHIMPACCGKFCLMGPDETIDYHYCIREAVRVLAIRGQKLRDFRGLPQAKRVDLIWEALYYPDGKPLAALSEAAIGLLTICSRHGIDVSNKHPRDILRLWREFYGSMSREAYSKHVFDTAGVSRFGSTQSIFVEEEAHFYLDETVMAEWDDRFFIGLRLDEMVLKPRDYRDICTGVYENVDAGGDVASTHAVTAAIKLLVRMVERMGGTERVKYMATSLPAIEDLSDAKRHATLALERVIYPAAKEVGLPVFLMPYVRRGIHSDIGNAGDIAQPGDINPLIEFIGRHPEVNTLVTPLNEGDHFTLSSAMCAMPWMNLTGHWWFNLTPGLIEEKLEMRMGMIGHEHGGFFSDARSEDHLLYKWPHYLAALRNVLTDKLVYGWEQHGRVPSEEEVTNSVLALQSPERIFRGALAA